MAATSVVACGDDDDGVGPSGEVSADSGATSTAGGGGASTDDGGGASTDSGSDSGSTSPDSESGSDSGSTSPDEGGPAPLVLASTGIWADVVANLACGGLAEVESIMGSGVDPHGYEPSMADRARMEEATLVVANGLGLEEGLLDTLEAVEAGGTPVFWMGDHADAIEFAASDDHEDDDHGHEDEGHDDDGDEADDHDDHDHEDEGHDDEADDHDHEGEEHDEDGDGHDDHEGEDHDDDGDSHDDHDHEADDHDHEGEGHDDEGEGHDDEGEGHDDEADDHGHEADGHEGHVHSGADPHVWFDPVRVSATLGELAEHLTDDAGLAPDAVADCLSRYQADLAQLHDELVEILSAVAPADRRLVTDHDALGYFADRYGFEVIGTVIPSVSTLAETNPAALEELAEVITETGVRAIFAEDHRSDDTIQALASRAGPVEVATLYTGSLGQPGSGADTYAGFMRTNAGIIADALGG